MRTKFLNEAPAEQEMQNAISPKESIAFLMYGKARELDKYFSQAREIASQSQDKVRNIIQDWMEANKNKPAENGKGSDGHLTIGRLFTQVDDELIKSHQQIKKVIEQASNHFANITREAQKKLK